MMESKMIKYIKYNFWIGDDVYWESESINFYAAIFFIVFLIVIT